MAGHTDPEPPPWGILRFVSGGRNGSAQEGGSEANSGGFRGVNWTELDSTLRG